MGDSNTTEIGRLVEQLGAGDPAGRAEAAERLCRAGAAADDAAVPLVRACGDDDDQVREWAVACLEELGPPPQGTVPQLTELAASRHPLVAYWAITLLGRSGQDAATAVTVLAACLGSAGDMSVRQRAAWALGRIGPAAAPARKALEKAAAEADPRLARLAREAVDSIGV
jgi:HEAT repeat protein